MAITDKEVRDILELVKECQPLADHNEKLIRIWEGDLLQYIEASFHEEFKGHPQTFGEICPRIAPINIWRRLIDKLARIYQSAPRRVVEDGNEQDAELLQFYEDCFNMNPTMNTADEYYSMFKNTLLQPFYDEREGKPRLRVVPSDRFFPYSTDKIDPTNPTHIVIPAGQELKLDQQAGKTIEKLVDIFWVFDDDEFAIVDADGVIKSVEPHGIERLPFTYVNRSKNYLIPPADSDSLRMTLLIPILISDLNYAAKFQSFSMMVATDVKDSNPTLAPNAILHIDSDPATDKQARFDVIKPQVDITEVMQMIAGQLAMWLQSRSIRPGAVGQMTAENFASGISKIVDEMDTAEERQKHVNAFVQAEADFWDLIMFHFHPMWVSQGLVENRHTFSGSAKVKTIFAEQLPLLSRKEIVETAKLELDTGLLDRRTALERLNPEMSEEQLDELESRIDESMTITVGTPPPPPGDDDDQDDEDEDEDEDGDNEDGNAP